MRRTFLVGGAQVRVRKVAVAVLILSSAGSALLLAGAAGATSAASQLGAVNRAAAVSYWSGTTKYPGIGYEFNFTEHGSKLTYFFAGGLCNRTFSEDNFPASVSIVHGKFDLNYIDHRAPSDRTDPGFHVIIKGQITGGTAKGTLEILDDPLLHGACGGVVGHWQAHNDTLTTT